MNALVTTGGAAALVPASMGDAMQMAQMMASAGFLAKELQTPGGALFVIEQAMRWNMSPFAVAMETSFIQGKPMFSGKVVAAAATSTGAVAGRLSYTYTGAGEERAVVVRGTVRGEAEPREVTVRLKDARTNNRVWQSQPDQQLAYHGARVWARRHTPEVMLGVFSPEEFDEPQAPPMPPARGPVVDAKPEPPAEAVKLPVLSPDGEIVAVAPARWASAVERALAKLEDAAAVRKWREGMEPLLDSIAEHYGDAKAGFEKLVADRMEALAAEADQ